MMRVRAFAVVFAALSVGGIAMAADQDPLAANWKAVELDGKAVEGLTLDYSLDKVAGNAGCNKFFGPIDLSEPDVVKIGPLGATRMFCEGKMDLERVYLAALQAAKTFALEGDVLVLKGDGGAALVKFRK